MFFKIGIVIEPETLIDSIESDINGINYIVSVGMPNPYRKQEILLVRTVVNIVAKLSLNIFFSSEQVVG